MWTGAQGLMISSDSATFHEFGTVLLACRADLTHFKVNIVRFEVDQDHYRDNLILFGVDLSNFKVNLVRFGVDQDYFKAILVLFEVSLGNFMKLIWYSLEWVWVTLMIIWGFLESILAL